MAGQAKRKRERQRARVVAPSRVSGGRAGALTALAALYLATVFLSGTSPKLPDRLVPRAPRYFAQVACLFPHAARLTIDYRLEMWNCDTASFVELDPRPHFPIHPDDKENRFHRVGHFYRRHRAVMQALEHYVVKREREREPTTPIGGIRVVSLRLPFPEVGEPVPRWERPPLEEIPKEQRRAWYWTPVSKRRLYCAGAAPDDGDATAARAGGV